MGATLTLGGVIGNVIGLINQMIPVLFALALVFFMWGCVKYIMSAGGEGGGHGTNPRDLIVWGLVSLFVIFSVWGILQVMCATLLGNGMCK